MPDPEPQYQRAVVRARFQFRGVPPRDRWDELAPIEQEVAAAMIEEQGEDAFVGERAGALQELDLGMASFLVLMDESIPDQELTSDDVDEIIQGSVRPGFAQAATRSESALEATMNDAIVRMSQGHRQGLRQAASGTSVDITDDAIRNMVERVAERTQGRRVASERGEVIMRRVYTDAQGATESFIRDNVGRPGRETARTLLRDMGSHPRIERALDDLGPRGERVRRAIQRAGRAGDDISAAGRNLYVNAKRAMAHELNQVQHEADVLTAAESPAVRTLQWRTSVRHPTLQSSPDVCDALEDLDTHRLGPGRYFPGATPSLPHPFCQCATIPNTLPPEEWGEAQYPENAVPNAPPRDIPASEIAAVLRSNITASSGDVTASKIRRATEEINVRLDIAWNEFADF